MSKISTLLTALLGCLSLALSACDMNFSEWVPDENADARYSVKVALAINVEVSPSQADTIDIVCSEDLAPFVKVVKKDSTYVVSYDLDKVKQVYGEDERFSKSKGVSVKNDHITLKGIPFNSSKVLVKLGLKNLRGLCAASSSSIICKGQWAIDTLSLAGHSNGHITFGSPIKSNHLVIESSSSGKIKGAFEQKETAGIRLSSGARLDGTIKAKEVHFKGSSGSEAKLRIDVEKDAFFSLSSGSDVEVSGESPNLFLKASSGADIKAYVRHESVTTKKSSGGSIEVQMLDKSDLEKFL